MAMLRSYHNDALRLREAIRKMNDPEPLISIDHHQLYHTIMSIILYWAAGKQLFEKRLQEHHGWFIGFYIRQIERLVRRNQRHEDEDEDGDGDGDGDRSDEDRMDVMADTVEEMMADSMRASGWTCVFEQPRRNEVLECCESLVRGLGWGLRGVLVGGSGGGGGNGN